MGAWSPVISVEEGPIQSGGITAVRLQVREPIFEGGVVPSFVFVEPRLFCEGDRVVEVLLVLDDEHANVLRRSKGRSRGKKNVRDGRRPRYVPKPSSARTSRRRTGIG